MSKDVERRCRTMKKSEIRELINKSVEQTQRGGSAVFLLVSSPKI